MKKFLSLVLAFNLILFAISISAFVLILLANIIAYSELGYFMVNMKWVVGVGIFGFINGLMFKAISENVDFSEFI